MPKRTEKKIFQEANSRCAKCGENDVSALQIHHIQSYAEVKEHKEANLILLCASCHAKIGNKEYKENDLLRLKISLIKGNSPNVARSSPTNTITLENSKNTGVVANANNLTIKTEKKTVKMLPPKGTIASNAPYRNYIKYLIDRYNKFKGENAGKGKMKYTVIYTSITGEFGAKWDMLLLDNFDRLSDYLKNRIDKTAFGRNQKAKGIKRYSTFEEHANK